MMKRYFALARLSHTSKLHLFHGIVQSKKGDHLRGFGSLSYTRMRELLLGKLSQLGFDTKQFGLHSLRAGGATAAANAGVADRLFKRHGRWRSESAKDGYVKDSVASLMSVTKSLDTLSSLPVLWSPIVGFDDFYGVHSRPYHSCDVISGWGQHARVHVTGDILFCRLT